MSDLGEKLEYALTRGNGYYSGFYSHRGLDLIYPFTTENISGYFQYFDFKNKDVLMICGREIKQ